MQVFVQPVRVRDEQSMSGVLIHGQLTAADQCGGSLAAHREGCLQVMRAMHDQRGYREAAKILPEIARESRQEERPRRMWRTRQTLPNQLRPT